MIRKIERCQPTPTGMRSIFCGAAGAITSGCPAAPRQKVAPDAKVVAGMNNMLINLPKFHSIEQAGRVCMKRAIECDEAALPDYERPTKEIKRVKLSPFHSQIIKYGLLTAIGNTIYSNF